MRAGDVVCVCTLSFTAAARRRHRQSRRRWWERGEGPRGRRQGRMTNAQRERLRYYKIIISYQPVCPPRSSTTSCLCVTPLWPLAVTLSAPPSPGLPCSRGPRATALADPNAASCHHSTCSRVTCRTEPIVTVYRVSENMCVVKIIYYCA